MTRGLKSGLAVAGGVVIAGIAAIITVSSMKGQEVDTGILREETTSATTAVSTLAAATTTTTSATTTTATTSDTTTSAETTTTVTTTAPAAATTAPVTTTTAAPVIAAQAPPATTVPPVTATVPTTAAATAAPAATTSISIKGVMGGIIKEVPENWVYESGDAISAKDITQAKTDILTKINESRVKVGAKELLLSEGLSKVAEARSKECASVNDILHKRPDGSDWNTILDEWGYTKSIHWYGENLGYTGGVKVNGVTVMDLWLKSQGHYDNLTRANYTHIGIGISAGTENNIYYSTIFVEADAKADMK